MFDPSIQWVIWFSCSLVDSSHLRPGELRERAKFMQVFLPRQNGSSENILIGEHFSALKVAGKAPFLPQHWMPWLGVWVMSWSMNWPICITRIVLSESALLSPTDRALLIFLADGSSMLLTTLFLGRSSDPEAYSGSRILWYGVPVLPKFGSRRLLQDPSNDLNIIVLLQVGAGDQGHLSLIALLVSLLKLFLSPMEAWRSVKLLSNLIMLVADNNTLLTSSRFLMSSRGLLNLKWKSDGEESSTKLVSITTSSATPLANTTLSFLTDPKELLVNKSPTREPSTELGMSTVTYYISFIIELRLRMIIYLRTINDVDDIVHRNWNTARA